MRGSAKLKLNPQTVERAIADALAEDLGAGDITSRAVIPSTARFTGVLSARELLVVAGLDLAGQVFAGTRQAYLYLPESIRRFPPPEAFCLLLERAGLCRVSFRRLTNGLSVIYTGVKPE